VSALKFKLDGHSKRLLENLCVSAVRGARIDENTYSDAGLVPVLISFVAKDVSCMNQKATSIPTVSASIKARAELDNLRTRCRRDVLVQNLCLG